MLEVAPITVKVDFPALDNLVDYLRGSNGTVTAAMKEAVAAPKKAKAKKEEQEVKTAPVEETAAEEPKSEQPAVEPATEPEPEKQIDVPDEPVKEWDPDEVAGMAMHLRDIDKAYSAKVKAYFPELGIKSLGDIRTNVEACAKLAEILIKMTAEAEGKA